MHLLIEHFNYLLVVLQRYGYNWTRRLYVKGKNGSE